MPEPPRPPITVHTDVLQDLCVVTFHRNEALIQFLGSDILPTRFPLRVRGQDVWEEVQRLNPHARGRLIDRDGTLLDPGTSVDSPGQDRSPTRFMALRYYVPGTPLTVRLHREDILPRLCIGLDSGDKTVYGGCDVHDADILADAIERRRELTLSASGRAQAQVKWVPNTLTLAIQEGATTLALPDSCMRATFCAVLRFVADLFQHPEDDANLGPDRRSP